VAGTLTHDDVATVVLPASWVSSLPSTQVIIVASSTSAAIVASTNVPSFVPSSVVQSLPSSVVVSVAVSSFAFVPATVAVPSSWHSPVVVPASYVSSFPSSAVVSIRGSPSAVIIQNSWVSSSWSSSIVQSIPSSAIVSVSVQTWVNDVCSYVETAPSPVRLTAQTVWVPPSISSPVIVGLNSWGLPPSYLRSLSSS